MAEPVQGNRHPDDEYTRGLRVERTLAHLESIPDPLERIRECEYATTQARTISRQIAAVRRKAVYELTLRPGASGETVAAELGVSAKAVSAAISEFRRDDLVQLRHALSLYPEHAATKLPEPEQAAALVTRDVLAAARAVLRANESRDLSRESDETFEVLTNAAQRARALATLGHVDVPRSVLEEPAPGPHEPDFERTDPAFRFLDRTLNALPQIAGYVTNSRQDSSWVMSWSIEAAEKYSSVADAGPHRDGWLATEWLVWFLRDYERAGYDIDTYVSSPPPFLNHPGSSLSFVAAFSRGGPLRPVDANELASSLREVWDETGYVDVEWPEKEPA